ncbi:MAG TPA: hypothetical protein VN176_18505 [Verrucomicrobiae bacterium]|jgi:hypothetical protein|nr:hypothetical protein [Verrucomicrobiae bacterium]
MPATTATVPDPRTVRALRVSLIACALVSLAALVAHIFHLLPMPFFLEVFGVPSLLVLYGLAAYARKIDAHMLTQALGVGVLAGLAATVVYDGVRFLVERGHLFGYNGFVPILMFGNWITGQPVGSTASKIAGWTYHYWNGATFGVIYALAMGRRKWLWGIAYGILMECCMLGLFPMFLRVTNKTDFIAVSMIGHLFYGATLGWLSEKYISA